MARSSTSISRSSSLPSRSILRNFWRVSSPFWSFGSSMSRIRSSAASVARGRTFATSSSRVCLTAMSTSSFTIESTSRPT